MATMKGLQPIIDRMTVPLEVGTVSAGGVQTSYLMAGTGPPVVLLHGAMGAGVTWHPVIGALADHFRVIAPDVVGHGESDDAPVPPDRSYLAAWLAHFVDALGVERAHVVGHSMGGAIALQFALECPTRLDRLVAVDAAGLTTQIPGSVALAFLWFGLFPSRAASLRLARLAVYDITNIDAIMGEYVLQVLARRGRRSLRGLVRRHRGAAVPLTREQLARITTPTLLIWGAEDRFFNVSAGRAAAERIPGAQLHLIPRAGHVPFFDQPAEFNAVLIRFLRGD